MLTFTDFFRDGWSSFMHQLDFPPQVFFFSKLCFHFFSFQIEHEKSPDNSYTIGLATHD